MGELFDDVARALARPSSGRRTVFRLVGLLAGAALAGLRPGRSEADTVCCNPLTGQCCPPNVACCGTGPTLRGLNCCKPGQTCCNPQTGACCSPGQQCCNNRCIAATLACCPPTQQACGKTTCCPPGQTCCDPQVGLCCPAGQACLASGSRHLCGQPCGNPTAVPQTFCVNGEVCCGSVCCPRGQVCCNGRCQAAPCCPKPCSFVVNVPATVGNSVPPDVSAWLDTGFDLVAGCGPVTIAATGTAQFSPVDFTTPASPGPGPACNPASNPPRLAPDCGAPLGALLGSVGGGPPFQIGAVLIFTPSSSGRLFLAYNDIINAYGNNSGAYQVSIVGPCA